MAACLLRTATHAAAALSLSFQRSCLVRLLCLSCVKEASELDKALVNFIVKDSQPFTVVDDPGFRAFVAKLDPT
ncbi:hypothetical protein CHARACLAT_030380 [Characodon lateralis]|uniref:Uncharacterized protein n=1 Tax=Characodon lateralis TaxID=208331 RepID=A0ABU7F7A4_9TELE|nr:hypothetical protein [Characodon lateralis]